jgi:hypothetical protein
MRCATICLFAIVCLVNTRAAEAQDYTVQSTDDPSTTTPAALLSNNTSACSADGTPSYCDEALPTLDTSTANQQAGADTLTVDAFPGYVSAISVARLMNHGAAWGGKIICEYQPWFSTASGTNGHLDIGYDEDNKTTVANQDTKMINRGCNINFIDFYGTTDSNQAFNLDVTNLVYSNLKGRSGFPLQFGLLEDQGAFDSACANMSEAATITCIENNLETDMSYIYSNYINVAGTAANPSANNTSLYWTDAGVNVIGFFGACGTFPALNCSTTNRPNDWDNIWSAVQTYVNGKSYNMKFIFQFGIFGYPAISAGQYAWPQPYTTAACQTNKDCFTSDPPSQLWWCGNSDVVCNGSSSNYLDQFYIQAQTPYSQGQVVVGLLDKGFDDTWASWGVDRVTSQQCGHVLLDTANEVAAGGYWGKTAQVPYMQMATWNDYEEGTEQESGISNCYDSVSVGYNTGSTYEINWSLGTVSWANGFAKTDTIHHYALYTAPHGQTTLTLRKQLASTVTEYDLQDLDLPAGTYDVYIEMVAQPSMQNQLSNSLEYIQGPS